MILQYKGYNNNWCYEEANTIIWANICVGRITQDYKEKKINLNQNVDSTQEMHNVQEMHKAVNELIQSETNCDSDIIYLIGNKSFSDLDNICVVTLKDKMKYITYVFIEGVYILNNSGGTVQKIA